MVEAQSGSLVAALEAHGVEETSGRVVRLSLEYRHSVEQTVVVEEYRWEATPPGGGHYVLERTVYRSLGAGLPPEGRLELLDGAWVLVLGPLERAVNRLVVRVFTWTEHAVTVEGRRFALAGAIRSGAVAEGAAVEIRVRMAGTEERGTGG